jgi:hypothetical protein
MGRTRVLPSSFPPQSNRNGNQAVARVGLLRRYCELAVFDARLYIRVRRIDEPA